MRARAESQPTCSHSGSVQAAKFPQLENYFRTLITSVIVHLFILTTRLQLVGCFDDSITLLGAMPPYSTARIKLLQELTTSC